MKNNAMIVAAGAAAALVLPASAGLIASYDFNGGSLADTSGGGFDAVEVGSMGGVVVDGVRGDVYDLTGGAGFEGNPGTYLRLLPDLGVPAPSGDWSLALWILDSETGKNSYLFDNRDFGATEDNRLIFSTEHNEPGANSIGLFDGTAWRDGGDTPIRDLDWHHVVWTNDSSTGDLTMYTDGVGVTVAGAASDLLTASVRLGNRSGDGAGGQDRQIDDVYLYDHALSQSEVDDLIAATLPPTVTAPTLKVALNGANLDFSWDSEEGLIYDLLFSTDLTGDPESWPPVGSNVAIPADPGGTNTLSIAKPADPRTFYVISAYEPPPVVLLAEDFELDQGGFVFVDDSGDTGTKWEQGAPSSDNGFGSLVSEGAPDSTAGCCAVNLGDVGNANEGFYNTFTNAALRSPAIDLTGVTEATLNYSEALDLDAGDTAVINFLDVDDSNNIVGSISVSDTDTDTSPWEAMSEAIPVGAIGKNIVIEWRLTSGGTATQFIGWYVDEVSVTTP